MKYIYKTSDFEVGDWVIYRSHPDAPAEDGRVYSVSEEYVFVLYKGDTIPKATRPSDLEFGCPSAHEVKE